jgi:hypothetical protein
MDFNLIWSLTTVYVGRLKKKHRKDNQTLYADTYQRREHTIRWMTNKLALRIRACKLLKQADVRSRPRVRRIPHSCSSGTEVEG